MGHAVIGRKLSPLTPLSLAWTKSMLPSCQVLSVWPKQLTAVITAVIFGQIMAESVLAIMSSYSITFKREFSAVRASYGRKYPVSISSAPWKLKMGFQMTHIELKAIAIRPNHMAENVSYGRKCQLRPKMAVFDRKSLTAEILFTAEFRLL